MQPWRTKALYLAGGALLLGALPAFSQNAPESLLPPGFGEPAPPPQTKDAAPTPPPPPVAPPPSRGVVDTVVTDATEADLEALDAQEAEPPIEIPDFARRSVDRVGAIGPANGGLGYDTFGDANGRFLSTLMRRVDAPLPSRWTQILLRRALLSDVPAPSYVHPVDWVAERAWLLLRMGEADGARILVQSVDVEQFTPKMFTVAVQTALATADPAALCPLVEPGRGTSDEPVWDLGAAMCASFEGEANRAGSLIDQARRRGTAKGIDLNLAEKIVGAGSDSRRATTIEWDGVDSLTNWRFGLAAASGMDIPQRLFDGANPRMQAWKARAPMIPAEQRVRAMEAGAALGVFSNPALVEMYSLIADSTDVTEFADSVGGRLRTAYVARTLDERLAALRILWGEQGADRYSRNILTAVAASGIPVSADAGDDSAQLIQSMLAAGLDRPASRWESVVGSLEGEAGERAWALLAVGAPRPQLSASESRIADFGGGGHRARLLFASLAGLGRIDEDTQEDLARTLSVPIGRQNAWTQRLDQAVRDRQPGTVALLAAAGMQTPSWNGVPPSHLYRIVRALRQVGLDYEARMIAAEAVSRA